MDSEKAEMEKMAHDISKHAAPEERRMSKADRELQRRARHVSDPGHLELPSGAEAEKMDKDLMEKYGHGGSAEKYDDEERYDSGDEGNDEFKEFDESDFKEFENEEEDKEPQNQHHSEKHHSEKHGFLQ